MSENLCFALARDTTTILPMKVSVALARHHSRRPPRALALSHRIGTRGTPDASACPTAPPTPLLMTCTTRTHKIDIARGRVNASADRPLSVLHAKPPELGPLQCDVRARARSAYRGTLAAPSFAALAREEELFPGTPRERRGLDDDAPDTDAAPATDTGAPLDDPGDLEVRQGNRVVREECASESDAAMVENWCNWGMYEEE